MLQKTMTEWWWGPARSLYPGSGGRGRVVVQCVWRRSIHSPRWNETSALSPFVCPKTVALCSCVAKKTSLRLSHSLTHLFATSSLFFCVFFAATVFNVYGATWRSYFVVWRWNWITPVCNFWMRAWLVFVCQVTEGRWQSLQFVQLTYSTVRTVHI